MTLPTDRQYTPDHEWLRIDGDIATVGVTAFAADALGDIVYLDLPAIGSTVTAGEPCGEIESTKSVSDLVAPADGEVIETNPGVLEDPGAVNVDPFGTGWLFRLRLASTPDLLDADRYAALIGDAS
jgi:glycine cleavage system H protein